MLRHTNEVTEYGESKREEYIMDRRHYGAFGYSGLLCMENILYNSRSVSYTHLTLPTIYSV